MAKERHKIIPSSYLVLIKDNKILLGRRVNTGYEDGNYGLPAGHVEEGETFTRGAIRESKEEIGITLNPKDLKVVHIMHRDSGLVENNERIDVFFTADNFEGEAKNMEPEKCDDLSWFDMRHLPDNIIPYIKEAIGQIKNKNHYSEYGWQ